MCFGGSVTVFRNFLTLGIQLLVTNETMARRHARNTSQTSLTSTPEASNSNASWTPEQVDTLLTLLRSLPPKEIADNGFKRSGWALVIREFNRRHPDAGYCRGQLKSKYQTLKADFEFVHKLLTTTSGFGSGFTLENNMVTAPASVWDEWINNASSENKKRLKRFRRVPFPYYDSMFDLCAGASATGEFATHPGQEDSVSQPTHE